MLFSSISKPIAIKLQWGRDHLIAEIADSLFILLSSTCALSFERLCKTGAKRLFRN
jgi:hypothetical protein